MQFFIQVRSSQAGDQHQLGNKVLNSSSIAHKASSSYGA
jgi:hypothetical protein